MQPGVTQTAAAARCIPNRIPDFPSDIPAQCGGNVQWRGNVKWGDEAERSNPLAREEYKSVGVRAQGAAGGRENTEAGTEGVHAHAPTRS